MFGKQDARLPKNSAQTAKETKHAPATAAADEIPDAPVNYVSDDEDKDKHGRPPLRRNRRILSQRQPAEGDSLNRIVSLVAKETAVVPPLSVEQHKLIRDYASANLILQLDEWAYNTWFVGVILNEKTGRRILSQRQPAEGDSLNRIVSLVAKETAVVPPLSVEQHKLIRDYASANLILQLDEWAYNTWFVGVILDEKTGDKLEYRDLIKRPELRERWMRSLANKLGRLSQGICNVKGTNTIYFIPKSEIPQD